NRAGRPRLRAVARPGASSLLLMTTAISAGIFPARTLRAMASKFEPRPERRIPSFFIVHPGGPIERPRSLSSPEAEGDEGSLHSLHYGNSWILPEVYPERTEEKCFTALGRQRMGIGRFKVSGQPGRVVSDCRRFFTQRHT